MNPPAPEPQPRTVGARQGWAWIVEGFAFFRASPAVWLGLLAGLFVLGHLLMQVPILGVVFVLLMPLFLVGLMEGCSALERGQPLHPAYLAAGFQRHAAQLVTIGGLTLLGNLLVMMLVMSVGGEPLRTVVQAGQQGVAPTPEMAAEAGDAVMQAMTIGLLASIPLLMALWFAPLLVHFHGLGPLAAMRTSLIACLRNAGALLVYGAAILLGMMLVLFLMIAVMRSSGTRLGPYDLALWALMPIVLPSIYASYKDIFLNGTPPSASDSAERSEPPPG